MLDFAKQSDYKDIVNLWKISFGDCEEYVSFFWNSVAKLENTPVYRVNGKVVAVYFLLESSVVIDRERYSSYYLYAAATDPKYRKQGIMSKLINYGLEIAKSRNIEYIVLVPASEHLQNYYSKLGFISAFKVKTLVLSRTQLEKINYETETSSRCQSLYDIRESNLSNVNHLSFDEKILNYALQENINTNGKVVIKSNSYALYCLDNNSLYVKEICNIYGSLNDLLNETKAENFVFELPINSELEGKECDIKDSGMIISVNGKEITFNDAYIGLSLG